jgi:folate-dependent phosphoribosylglycinamide formyltransferase PurN
LKERREEKMGKERELRTALLISGGGTTAEAVIKACQSGELKGISPVAVIASRPDAPGIGKAEALGIASYVVQRKDFFSAATFGNELLRILRELKVDLVSQNGWLVKTPPAVIEEYQGRILNQHPGPLDPGRGLDFGGKGMYGARVVCARLAYAWITGENKPWTEATTHYVTEEYDQGDLIRVSKMEIASLGGPVAVAQLRGAPQQLESRTKEVQAQLLPLEHKNVIATLRMFGERRQGEGYRRKKPLIPRENEEWLNQAKNLAIELFPEG